MHPREFDVAVIGGGVAGLAAAEALARDKLRVCVLEARGRTGGRVHAAGLEGWPGPVDLGAEFIHGGAEEFWAYVEQSGMPTRAVPDRHWLFHNGILRPAGAAYSRIQAVLRRIPEGSRAGTFAGFLQAHQGDVEQEDRVLAQAYVEGFHAAPAERMSASALRESADAVTDPQFRIEGGYIRIVQSLEEQARAHGAEVFLNSPVETVEWDAFAGVTLKIRPPEGGSGPEFSIRAKRAVVTLPLGVLRASVGSRGAVEFRPALEGKRALLARWEPAKALRLVFHFRASFLESLRDGAGLPFRDEDFGFVHSLGLEVPVWWSPQWPEILVGWAAGPSATALENRSHAEILEAAVRSLGWIFGRSAGDIMTGLKSWQFYDWTHDPYSQGAYGYIAAGLENASEQLREPVGNVLFFAGEATAEDIGTVHGAYSSGLRAAREVQEHLVQNRT